MLIKKQELGFIRGAFLITLRGSIFLTLWLLIGCDLVQHTANNHSSVAVDSELTKFSYKGKGSSAGFMLMSSLGPAGIAVGIAIDEGISKDITESAFTAFSKAAQDDVGFQTLLDDYFQTALNIAASDSEFLKTSRGQQSLLQRYFSDPQIGQLIFVKQAGFIAAPKDQESAIVLVEFQIELSDSPVFISSQMVSNSNEWPSAPLEQLKTDGAVVELLWVNSLVTLLKSPVSGP